jgi:hypothetical protein
MRDNSQSRALREANDLFKPIKLRTAITDYEQAQQAFLLNRERLKAARLWRAAEIRRERGTIHAPATERRDKCSSFPLCRVVVA